MTRAIEFSIRSHDKAVRMYRAGLKHRILTLPVRGSLGVGDEIIVILSLPFAGERFELTATVKHCSSSSTILQLGSLPERLVELISRAPTDDEPEEPTIDADSTDGEAPPPESPAEEPPSPEPSAEEPDVEDAGAEEAARPAPSSRFRLSRPGRKGDSSEISEVPGTTTQQVKIGATGARGKGGIPVPGGGGRTIGGELLQEGEIEEKGMRGVFLDQLRRGATGVLVVEGYRERYWALVVDGRPVRYRREPPSRSDTLDYQASRARLVQPDELNAARQLAELTGMEMRVVLQRLELLAEEQVETLESRNAQQVTERLLGVNYGTYKFYGMPLVSRVLSEGPVDVMRILWSQARQKYADLSDKQIASRIDEYHKHHVVVTDEGAALIGELRLDMREQGFVDRYLRGGWQLAELLGRLDLTNRSVMETLLTLQDLDIVVLSEREGPNWKLARAERFLIDRLDYLGKDHFAFVDAHWSSLDRELASACDRVARNLDDPLLDELPLERIGQMRQEIRDKLVEVRGIFADRDRRQAYRATLIERGKLAMASSLFAKKGEMALFKREATVARDCFLRVIEVDPGGPGTEHVGRARRVLEDISRGVLTKTSVSEDRDSLLPSLEDLDR